MSNRKDVTTHSGAQPWNLRRWGLAWFPIPLLLAAIIAARATGLHGSYESPTLLLILSFAFYTLVSLGTLYLIGRSFIASGSPGLLLLECGVVLWSLAGTVGDFVSRGDANVNVTIFNTGILLSGICHFTGTILLMQSQKRILRSKPLWLGAGIAFTLGALWLVSKAAFTGWLPVFFIPGQGGTLVRYFVLISAIAMFVLSAALLNVEKRALRIPFTFWYALAMLLLAVGLFGIMIQLSLGSVVNWLSRAAQWLGGVYLLFAAVASLRESRVPFLPQEDKAHPAYYRVVIAIAIVVAAAAIRLTFLSTLGTRAPFLLFYPAVMFAALYGGMRSALLATVLSAILADYFWIEPIGIFNAGDFSDWLSIVIFLLSGAMIGWVTNIMHSARARAAAAETQSLLASEREASMKTLLESRAKLETALAGMTDAVFITDAEGRLMDFNDAFATYYRFRNKEECPKTFAEYSEFLEAFMVDGEPATPDQWAIPRALRGETATNVEYTLRRKDTGENWFGSYSFGPIRDKDGVIVGSVATARDITERKRAEEAFRSSEADKLFVQEQLNKEMKALAGLHELSTLYLRKGELQPTLTEIVDASIAVSGADFGNIQVIDKKTGDLTIVAQRGFPQWWLDFWSNVQKGKGSCGTALERGERVIIEDVEQSPIFRGTAGLEVQLKAGIRAVQSTPLVSRSGKTVGIFSTHYRNPHNPDDRTLQLMDLLARNAADIIDHAQAEESMNADLKALTRMHDLSGRMLDPGGLDRILQEVMDAAVAIMKARRGTLQLLEGDSLKIVAHHGHGRPFLEFFASAKNRASVCGETLISGDRVIVPDIEESALFAGTPSLPVLRAAGVRAVQSTPMKGRSGEMLGILTTHWDIPYTPDEHDLWRIDLLARQAADLIEKSLADAALQRSKEELEIKVQERTSELMRVAEDLRISEEDHRLMVELNPVGVYRHVYNPATREIKRLHCNEAHLKILGYSSLEEYLNESPGQMSFEGNWEKYTESLLANGNVINFPVRMKRKDGRMIWVLLNATSRARNDGIMVEGAMTNISAQKQTEERLRSAQKKLRAMASEIVLADERSRQHFATDLHDTVVQTLGAAKLRSQLIQDKIQPEIKPIFSEMQDMLSQSINQARSIMAEMSPPVLYELGFAPALEWLCEQMGKQNNLSVEFRAKNIPLLTHELQVLLFQSTRELLMNVIKHAKADNAAVKISANGSKLKIEVKDDGIGFDDRQAFRTDVSGGGFGLFSIRERLKNFGGHLSIRSKHGQGTNVVMTIPKSDPPQIL